MAIPFLKAIQSMRKRRPPQVAGHHHLMLAGISQTLFRKNWGEPDAEISLKKLGIFFQRGGLYLSVKSEDDADYSVWIYKERDRVLFFTKKKLIVHFKWSGFDRRRQQSIRGNGADAAGITPSLIGKTLALVA